MKEEEEFPDVDEVALITQSRGSGGRNNASNTTSDLENARSNANIDVETAWKLMDFVRAEGERRMRERIEKKIALGRRKRGKANNNLRRCQHETYRRQIPSNSRKFALECRRNFTTTTTTTTTTALIVSASVPSFLRDTLGDGDGANKEASNATEEKKKKNINNFHFLQSSSSHTARGCGESITHRPISATKLYRRTNIKNTVKAIVKKVRGSRTKHAKTPKAAPSPSLTSSASPESTQKK